MSGIKKQRHKRSRIGILMVIILAAGVYFIAGQYDGKPMDDNDSKQWEAYGAEKALIAYVKKNGLNMEEYPDALITMLKKNKEAKKFVFEYPKKKDRKFKMNLKKSLKNNSVPLFIQWDQRWGYSAYGKSLIGISGCGPTCLSMVAVYLLKDTSLNPKWMCQYSEKNGYYTPGQGTAWALMTDGARGIGLKSTELPLDKQRIIDQLQMGNPIICSMGPGEFTSSGHYIILTDYEDNRLSIKDPNSLLRSGEKWKYEEIYTQIKNLWVFQK
ncbi:MAG: C39 family peptidase [Lachnospiraceae bacterium]